MTDHTHTVITPGCYRCELNLDEMEGYLQSLVVTRSGVVHDPDCHYLFPSTKQSTATSWVFSDMSSDRACKVCLPDGTPKAVAA